MLTVRPARADDDAALLPIDRVTWTPDVSPATPREARSSFLEEEWLPDVLVAEDDGVVVGYGRLAQTGPLPSHDHVLAIDGLAVDPARQGRGIGRHLVEAAVQEARRRSARKVTLRVLATNARARRLYEACGFVEEGVLRQEFLLAGAYVDDVLMALPLDPPSPSPGPS